MKAKKQTVYFVLLALVMVLAPLFTPARPVQAASPCTVTNDADSGEGSLRYLVEETGCETIDFAASFTILFSRQIVVIRTVTIDGSSQDVTLSGGGQARIFVVEQAGDLNLNRVTVANGFSYFGSGLINYGKVNIFNTVFMNNHSVTEGGAISNWGGDVRVSNSVFYGNSSIDVIGGAIHTWHGSVAVTNSTFSNNSAVGDYGSGGGIYNDGGAVTVANSILWNNPGGEIVGGATVTYSDVQGDGEVYPGVGNIDAYPRFVDAASGNLRLLSGSPAVDAGNSDALPKQVRKDLDGSSRFVDIKDVADTGLGKGPIVDMGAYEVQKRTGKP